MFDSLLPTALQCGVKIFEFWDLTYGEIILIINAHNANLKAKMQQEAALNHQHANLIGLSVARLMDKNAEYPSLYEAYPNLFEELKPQPVVEDWQIIKDRLMRYADAHNQKKGGR